MVEQSIQKTAAGQDDRILPLTRWVAWIVIPFLAAAFIILYVDGQHLEQWFSWQIPSRLTTALMGAGYIGGAYFFLRVGFGRKQRQIQLDTGQGGNSNLQISAPTPSWHEVHLGYGPVTLFTIFMLLATVLHWDKFLTDNWPFWVWLVIYVVTPLLVPLVWLINRGRDPGMPEPGDRLVPGWLRIIMGAAGLILLLLTTAAFIYPDVLINMWPWTLTPLTARVMAGFHAILGVGALVMASDQRWSAWRIPMQSIVVWYGLMLLALFLHQAELGAAGMLNWYTFFVLSGLVGLLLVTLIMRLQPRYMA